AHPAAVEPAHEARADEAGGAGDDVVGHAAANTSLYVATAVPNLPTTMPAARLAMRIAASTLWPAASITASVAMTVSPAPLTSNTSRASVLMWSLGRSDRASCLPRRA